MANKLSSFTITLISSLLMFSCVSTNYGFHIPEDTRDQFVRIIQNINLTFCAEDQCMQNKMMSSGSGVVVDKSPYGSYILTAGHVCEVEMENILKDDIMAKTLKRVDIDFNIVNLAQSKYIADIISIDDNSDMCLMFAPKYWNEKGPIDIADRPAFEGERVYNVAAPVGIFYENTVPLFEGFFMGKEDLRSYYSIPAMGGSSGSPVINLRGDLVGMIHSVNAMFPMVSVSPNYKNIKNFITSNVKAHKDQQSSCKNAESKKRKTEPFWKGLGILF